MRLQVGTVVAVACKRVPGNMSGEPIAWRGIHFRPQKVVNTFCSWRKKVSSAVSNLQLTSKRPSATRNIHARESCVSNDALGAIVLSAQTMLHPGLYAQDNLAHRIWLQPSPERAADGPCVLSKSHCRSLIAFGSCDYTQIS